MDIWHIIPTTNHGGNETFARSLINNFPLDIKHTVFSMSNINGSMARDIKSIAELKKLNTKRNFKTLISYFNILKEHKPRIIILHTFNSSLLLFILIAKLFGIKKLTITVANPPPKEYFLKISIFINFLRFLKIPLIFCSNYILKEFKNSYPIPPKSRYISYGCDLEKVNFSKGKINDFIKNKRTLFITMVARFDCIKDQETLIRSFLEIKQKNWQLNLVGDGLTKNYLEELVNSLGGSQKINFLGSRNDIINILNCTDIFAFSTTNKEGFGIVLIEALSVGCPIVASDVPACREVLINGEGGILIPPGNIESWKRNLSILMNSSQKRKDLSYKSKKLSKLYDIKLVANKYIDFIDEI